MIESLTDKQKEKMKDYVVKWVKIGTCTKPSNKPLANELILQAYKEGGVIPPEKIVWVRSPLEACYVIGAIEQFGFPITDYQIDEIVEKVKKTKDKTNEPIKDVLDKAIYGQSEADVFSFHDYFREELGLIDQTQKIKPLIEISKQTGFIVPYEKIVFLSEKYTKCYIEDGRIHCDHGPAIEYNDGFKIYALWGVIVPGWVIETPADDIPKHWVLSMQNTEQRTVCMKYIGYDKFEKELEAKVIDQKADYKLMTFKIKDQAGRKVTVGPYLKMKDTSTNRWFVEGVGSISETGLDETIKTVDDALVWRDKMAAQSFLEKFGLKLDGVSDDYIEA